MTSMIRSSSLPSQEADGTTAAEQPLPGSETRGPAMSIDGQATTTTTSSTTTTTTTTNSQSPRQNNDPRRNGSTLRVVPRNEKILSNHINSLLTGVQEVSAGFYGARTRSRVMASTEKLAQTGDASCANIEANLNESMATLMRLQVQSKDMDDKVVDLVREGKTLQAFLNDLNAMWNRKRRGVLYIYTTKNDHSLIWPQFDQRPGQFGPLPPRRSIFNFSTNFNYGLLRQHGIQRTLPCIPQQR